MMRKRTNCPRWMYRREDSFMVHAAQSDTMAPGRMVLPALCLGSFITTLNFVAPAPFLPAMSRDLDVSVALLGQITAAMMILSAVLALVVGPVADRYGSRRFILIGLIATVVSLFDFALAPVFFLLFIASIAGSIAEATVPGLSLAIAGTRFHGPAARRAIGWTVGALAGAPIIGVPILTTVGDLAGWRCWWPPGCQRIQNPPEIRSGGKASSMPTGHSCTMLACGGFSPAPSRGRCAGWACSPISAPCLKTNTTWGQAR